MSASPHSNAPLFLRVDHRELATILAALRFHQDENLQGGEPIPDKVVEDIATDGGTLKPLDFQEIERLCQRLNLDSEPAGLNVEPPHREHGPDSLFRVVYVIDVNAANPQEAAQQVYQIMVDPQSQPPMLQVMDASARVRDVDLSEP